MQNDATVPQFWHNDLADTDVEGIAIDRALLHPWCHDASAGQACDQCCGCPVVMLNSYSQALAGGLETNAISAFNLAAHLSSQCGHFNVDGVD